MYTKALNSNGDEVSKALHLVLTAETSECDPIAIQNVGHNNCRPFAAFCKTTLLILLKWKDEGYETHYLPHVAYQKDYLAKLHQFSDGLELGDTYAVVGQHSPDYREESLLIDAVQRMGLPRLRS